MTADRRIRAMGAGRLAAAMVLALGTAATARGDENWVITRFDVRLDVGHDGTVDVTETIAARFDEPKHGIYREIPVRYDVHGQLYDLRLHLKGVDRDTGGRWETYELSDVENRTVLKIGDPKKTLTGDQKYVIRYRVARAVLWEGEHAVLRWNATGTEWRVPIGGSSVTVVLPEPLDDGRVQADAWTGVYGAKQKEFVKTRVDPRTLKFATGPLGRGEGITVEVAMPDSAVVRPSLANRFFWWLADNFVYGLIPLGLLSCAWLWFSRGRDDPGLGTVVVRYEPPEDLGPAEVGTLADERVDLRDVTAVIIDLAVRGFISIEETRSGGKLWSSSDYELNVRKAPQGLKKYEQIVYDNVFSGGDRVKLSDLRNKFSGHLSAVRTELYKSLAKRGYFAANPESVRWGYLGMGLLAVAAALITASVAQLAWVGRVFMPPLLVTAVALVGMVFLTSRVMPRRTRKGRIAWEQVRGLEEFISRAEVDDLKAQERQGVFERLLPYATAFNLTTHWAAAFEGLYSQPPDWYRPASDGPFTMRMFGSSIDRCVHTTNSTLPSQPRAQGSGSSGWSSGGFGGGGSSGGGFGGGGGGSW